jgi:hypothetical protein
MKGLQIGLLGLFALTIFAACQPTPSPELEAELEEHVLQAIWTQVCSRGELRSLLTSDRNGVQLVRVERIDERCTPHTGKRLWHYQQDQFVPFGENLAGATLSCHPCTTGCPHQFHLAFDRVTRKQATLKVRVKHSSSINCYRWQLAKQDGRWKTSSVERVYAAEYECADPSS